MTGRLRFGKMSIGMRVTARTLPSPTATTATITVSGRRMAKTMGFIGRWLSWMAFPYHSWSRPASAPDSDADSRSDPIDPDLRARLLWPIRPAGDRHEEEAALGIEER